MDDDGAATGAPPTGAPGGAAIRLVKTLPYYGCTGRDIRVVASFFILYKKKYMINPKTLNLETKTYLGTSGNRTRDLLHPKQESYH